MAGAEDAPLDALLEGGGRRRNRNRKGGDDSVMENPMAQVGRKLRDAVSVLFAGFSKRGRLLALAAVASALQPQVRAALNHWEPELVDIVATTAGVTRRP